MSTVHAAIGFAIVGALGVLWLWGLGIWILRRRDAGRPFWWIVAFVQVALIVQAVAGVVLLAMGRRQSWLHYVYGSLFPAVVLVGAHWAARLDRYRAWVFFSFAAFIAFGLTARALMTGLGLG
ncbi:MAG: hypothetical protein HY658_11625 [Actinobacteria bacterium]|nr:hypothetical protein [Actinomycetota bacterium]